MATGACGMIVEHEGQAFEFVGPRVFGSADGCEVMRLIWRGNCAGCRRAFQFTTAPTVNPFEPRHRCEQCQPRRWAR